MGDIAEQMARECLAIRARRLNRVVTRLYDEALRPHGVTVAQANLLVGIGVAGPVAAADLGRALDLEKSTLSRNLALLADKGWITRSRDLSLTAAGRRMLERIHPAWEQAQEQVKARLSPGALITLEAMALDLRGE